MSSAQEIQKRLEEMPHLKSAQELAQEADNAAELEAAQEAERKRLEDPRSKRTYGFTFRQPLGDKIYEGDFQNKVPDVKTTRLIGLMRSHLAAGQSYERLDPYTKEQFLMLSHLSYSLVVRPDWAKVLDDLDPWILTRLYEEVALHEATFRGQRQDQGGGQE